MHLVLTSKINWKYQKITKIKTPHKTTHIQHFESKG